MLAGGRRIGGGGASGGSSQGSLWWHLAGFGRQPSLRVGASGLGHAVYGFAIAEMFLDSHDHSSIDERGAFFGRVDGPD